MTQPGNLLPELASQWGMNEIPVIAGGGDNAAGAVGVGIVQPGNAMLSLGTSGVYFVVSDGFYSNPQSAVHAFCHALPKTWHLMSVVLSAASCLQWYADNVAHAPVATLLDELENSNIDISNNGFFLPYLSGERTPHNNPNAQGAFIGLTHSTSRAAMTHAVLEGVSFALYEGAQALHSTGIEPEEITLIGGGSQSAYWRQMLADVFNKPMAHRSGGEVGPALGAARLAQLAVDGSKSLEEICPVPPLKELHTPNPKTERLYQARFSKFKLLYQQLKDFF